MQKITFYDKKWHKNVFFWQEKDRRLWDNKYVKKYIKIEGETHDIRYIKGH